MNLADKSTIITGPVREGEPIKMRRLLTVRTDLTGNC
ncbi:hypothetical protein MNBD_ALPHA05-1709 [hydrothermal vent metagenome]|uniref:Uncharacterized protein n=1 Tax=hydrothermal vent metagenome TaxID=652676 RepID=A0A3B0SFS2_9ZZZZ